MRIPLRSPSLLLLAAAAAPAPPAQAPALARDAASPRPGRGAPPRQHPPAHLRRRQRRGVLQRDGKRLIFQSTRDGRTCDQQYVMNVDGSNVKRISNGQGKTTCGYFFASDREDLLRARPSRPTRPARRSPIRPRATSGGSTRTTSTPRTPTAPASSALTQLRRLHRRGHALARRQDDRLHVAQGR